MGGEEVSGVSMVSNAPPTCSWDVGVTIRVLERRAQWAAKMSVLTFSPRSVGRERPETSQEVNKWKRSSEEEVTIRASRNGKLAVHAYWTSCEVAQGSLPITHKPLPGGDH